MKPSVNDHAVCKSLSTLHKSRIDELKTLIVNKKHLLPMTLDTNDIKQAMADQEKSNALIACLDMSRTLVRDALYYNDPTTYYRLSEEDTNFYSSILCFKLMKLSQ
jgi:hypothetical protein